MRKRILLFALLGLIALGMLQSAMAQQWYKGHLHSHSHFPAPKFLP